MAQLVARTAGGREVAGSSPVIPTIRIDMNQRVAIRAIIKKEDKILLLRRSTGRESILGLYELPGGRLGYGEQPEDALRRFLHDDVGIHIGSAKLFDVVSYIDKDDRDIQYAVIAYDVVLAEGHHELRLGSNYDQFIWQELNNSQQNSTTDLTQLLLGIIHQEHITDSSSAKINMDDDINTSDSEVIIYADGGSRGNPGPSASGFIIMDRAQNIVSRGNEYLGITTNNQAEYHGVRIAMERAIELGYKKIDFRLDSMLVVNQMNGAYVIKNRDLWPINERIHELMKNFEHVSFRHVPRESNQLADAEVNQALDAHKLQQHTEDSDR